MAEDIIFDIVSIERRRGLVVRNTVSNSSVDRTQSPTVPTVHTLEPSPNRLLTFVHRFISSCARNLLVLAARRHCDSHFSVEYAPNPSSSLPPHYLLYGIDRRVTRSTSAHTTLVIPSSQCHSNTTPTQPFASYSAVTSPQPPSLPTSHPSLTTPPYPPEAQV